jgi:hypothetical protein
MYIQEQHTSDLYMETISPRASAFILILIRSSHVVVGTKNELLCDCGK